MKTALIRGAGDQWGTFVAAVALFLLAGLAAPIPAAAPVTATRIVSSRKAMFLEKLAAREVQRYVYVCTGRLLPIQEMDGPLGGKGDSIAVAERDSALFSNLAGDDTLRSTMMSLPPEGYLLRTMDSAGSQVLLVTGSDGVGTLYAAYRLAEHLGVRFYLHGDQIPVTRVAFRLPTLDEVKKPLFKLRGIQPFHDFPEGPDWWNRDDYLAIISQLPKLRMNFFGLHTYPEGGPNAEPTVWIGPPSEIGPRGQVTASYPSSYQNTLRGNWGYVARKTSDFSFGAGELFERDAFGPDLMRDACPQPTTSEGCNDVFNRAGTMLRDAFQLAHALGVKTCVGTETSLTIPQQVQARFKAQGKDPQSRAVLEELYEGIFRRATQAYDPDYYWFWTPEGWTWDGTKEEQVKKTIDDLLTAIGAAGKVSPRLQLATCGWVLGPQQDRALFDKVLPKEVAVSCINREVGKTPVDKGFAQVKGRGKWAIPWMEDDPALTSPQLWVGRMRRDAADALRYGCDGLMGIHWRTRVLAPNVSALAQAAWDQVDRSTVDFYRDWAAHEFGKDIASAAADIFAKVDGRLPRPSDWVDGPGGIKPDPRSWEEEVQREYGFVDELAALGPQVRAPNRDRFEYWLHTFQYMKAMGRVNCTWAQFNRAMQQAKAQPDTATQRQLAAQLALPLRERLVECVAEVYEHLLAVVSNPGELGTVANWDQHILPDLLTKPGEELAHLLGEPLPAEAQVRNGYRGPTRVIVPTLRGSLAANQLLVLKVIILSEMPPQQAIVQWRAMGTSKFHQVALEHQARGVYSAQLPVQASQGTAFEYCVKVITQDGKTCFFPTSAPAINQTVVVLPEGKS